MNNFHGDNIGDDVNDYNDVDDNDIDDNDNDNDNDVDNNDVDVDDNDVDDTDVDVNDNDNEFGDNDVDDADVVDNNVDDSDVPDSRRYNFDRRSSFRETDPCSFRTSNRYVDTGQVDRRAQHPHRRDPEPEMRPEVYPEVVKSIPGVSNPQFYCHTWDQCYKTFYSCKS